MTSRKSWDQVFIEFTNNLSNRSSCIKLKTASIIINEDSHQILSIGYNGTITKQLNCDRYWLKYYLDNVKKLRSSPSFEEWIKTSTFKDLHKFWSQGNELHAEANALKYIGVVTTDNVTIYTLYSPCDMCAKDILAHSIKTVKYKHVYKHGINALKRLRDMGINCIQIK